MRLRLCCLISRVATGGFAVRWLAGMGARAVYRARLESVCTLIGTEGSNPSPSAISLRLPLVGFSDRFSVTQRCCGNRVRVTFRQVSVFQTNGRPHVVLIGGCVSCFMK